MADMVGVCEGRAMWAWPQLDLDNVYESPVRWHDTNSKYQGWEDRYGILAIAYHLSLRLGLAPSCIRVLSSSTLPAAVA